MEPDLVTLEMAYEAERDKFDHFYQHGPPPAELAPRLRETYLRGRDAGYRDAMAFEPLHPGDPPLELDGVFPIAWEAGYSFGANTGRIYHEMLLKRATKQVGIIFVDTMSRG